MSDPQPLNELQAECLQAAQEIHSLTGRLSNRDPADLSRLRQENLALKEKADLLERDLSWLLSSRLLPASEESATLQYESARQASIEYFKNSQADPELWKNIES